MASMMMKSGLRALKVSASRTRAPLRVRASADNNEKAPDNGTIFYGGVAYKTEQEWRDALASGKVAQPAAVGQQTSAAAAAMPTMNDVMGFSGSAPEIVNGRLAMLGFVAAVAAEFSSGEGVLRQWGEEPTGIAATFMLFIAASLVPAFLNKKAESLGPFTPQAEMLNGRAAMIGFAALMVIEGVRGGVALF